MEELVRSKIREFLELQTESQMKPFITKELICQILPGQTLSSPILSTVSGNDFRGSLPLHSELTSSHSGGLDHYGDCVTSRSILTIIQKWLLLPGEREKTTANWLGEAHPQPTARSPAYWVNTAQLRIPGETWYLTLFLRSSRLDLRD